MCANNGIRHKLTRPYHPQTNGMAERFNRRLSQVLRQAPPSGTNNGKNRFTNHDERNCFIEQFVDAYNRTRLKCLGYIAPLKALNNQSGQNTHAGIVR